MSTEAKQPLFNNRTHKTFVFLLSQLFSRTATCADPKANNALDTIKRVVGAEQLAQQTLFGCDLMSELNIIEEQIPEEGYTIQVIRDTINNLLIYELSHIMKNLVRIQQTIPELRELVNEVNNGIIPKVSAFTVTDVEQRYLVTRELFLLAKIESIDDVKHFNLLSSLTNKVSLLPASLFRSTKRKREDGTSDQESNRLQH